MARKSVRKEMNQSLNDMSVEELQVLRKDVDRALANFEERQRIDAIAAAQAEARKYGYKLEDLVGGGKRGAKGAPRYVHP